MREGYICWASHGAGTGRVAAEDIPASRATMARRLLMVCRALSSTGFKQNTPLFTPIRWWRGQAPRHGCQPPFLDIRLDKDEARLSEIDVYGARTVCADGWEEVLRFQAVGNVLEFLAVAGEEEGAGAGAVADAYDVALDVGGAVGGGCERLVVAALTGGGVGYGVFVPAWVVLVLGFWIWRWEAGGGVVGLMDEGDGEAYQVDEREDMVSWPCQC